MPVPVIVQNQSAPGFYAGEEFSFQMAAYNTPSTGGWGDAWEVTHLPDGLALDGDTGEISGNVALPGVYSFVAIARNTNGTSNAVAFTIGIEAGSSAAGYAPELWFDLITKTVTNVNPTAAGAAVSDQVAAPSGEVAAEILYLKSNDIQPLRIRFTRGSVAFDPGTLDSLKMTFKELEPESALFSGATWVKVGSGASAYWEGHVQVTGSRTRAALANNETDLRTAFSGLAEIEVAWTPDGTQYKVTSRTFPVTIERDLDAA